MSIAHRLTHFSAVGNSLYALIELITLCLIKIYVARYVEEKRINTLCIKTLNINYIVRTEKNFYGRTFNASEDIFILQAWLMIKMLSDISLELTTLLVDSVICKNLYIFRHIYICCNFHEPA